MPCQIAQRYSLKASFSTNGHGYFSRRWPSSPLPDSSATANAGKTRADQVSIKQDMATCWKNMRNLVAKFLRRFGFAFWGSGLFY